MGKTLVSDRFSQLKYPVHEVKYNLLHEFSDFTRHKEFTALAPKKRDKIIRYIVFLYDKKSDLFKEYSQLEERKHAAAVEAGYERDQDRDWETM